MSALQLKLLVLLCLLCTALSDAASRGVEWKELGQAITIQCRCPSNQQFLSLKFGLHEQFDVFLTENSQKNVQRVAKEFTGRLQSHGAFPNVDILLKNLTSNDTGPYWCVYKMFDKQTSKMEITKGSGSVLLVVTGGRREVKDEGCEASRWDVVLVSVVICSAVLLGIIMGFLIWIVLKKTRSLRATVRPRRVATNDVYEDMRGTLRR